MMYKFYLDGVLLPITPGSLTIKTNNKDETVDLIDGGTLTVINPQGLTEFEFEFLLPAIKLPFAQYESGYKAPQYYINKLEKLKNSLQPFRFIMVRSSSRTANTLNEYDDTNIEVTLSECTITEDAEEAGRGKKVQVTLRQYTRHATKLLDLKNLGLSEPTIYDDGIQRNWIVKEGTYIIQEGDTFNSIAFEHFGDEKYGEALAAVNDMDFTLDPLNPGDVLTIDWATVKKKYDEMHVDPTETTLWENSLYINGVQSKSITRSEYELYLQMIEPFAKAKTRSKRESGYISLWNILTGKRELLPLSEQPPLIQFSIVLNEMLDSLTETEDSQLVSMSNEILKLNSSLVATEAAIEDNKAKLEAFEKEAETELTESLERSIKVTEDLIATYEKTHSDLLSERDRITEAYKKALERPANSVTLDMSTELNNNLTTALANVKADTTSASIHTSWAFEIGLIEKGDES